MRPVRAKSGGRIVHRTVSAQVLSAKRSTPPSFFLTLPEAARPHFRQWHLTHSMGAPRYIRIILPATSLWSLWHLAQATSRCARPSTNFALS